jgi:hypothetical protein
VIRAGLTVLCLLATAVGLYNVYSDDSAVVKRAAAQACGASGCVRMLRAERTPIGHDFTFQVSLQPAATRSVECRRAYLLVGDMDCTVHGQ